MHPDPQTSMTTGYELNKRRENRQTNKNNHIHAYILYSNNCKAVDQNTQPPLPTQRPSIMSSESTGVPSRFQPTKTKSSWKCEQYRELFACGAYLLSNVSNNFLMLQEQLQELWPLNAKRMASFSFSAALSLNALTYQSLGRYAAWSGHKLHAYCDVDIHRI